MTRKVFLLTAIVLLVPSIAIADFQPMEVPEGTIFFIISGLGGLGVLATEYSLQERYRPMYGEHDEFNGEEEGARGPRGNYP